MTKGITLILLVLVFIGAAIAQKGPEIAAQEPRAGHPITIPTRYLEHRFIATPVTEGGATLQMFTDSAGGLFLYKDVVDRLRLPLLADPGNAPGAAQEPAPPFVSLPRFKADAAIPSPIGSNGGRVAVFPRRGDVNTDSFNTDGMLGQQWFAGRVWTFDYPRKRLLWRAQGDLPAHDKSHEAKLAFKTDEAGGRALNFARIAIQVDGESLDFLFDTGATNVLSAEALKLIADGGPADRATSFLTVSQFEKWRQRHPNWRVLDKVKTMTGSAMIEVPEVTIGGYTVGPVWFTVQPDRAFHSFMAQFMDKASEGAIGGSALHYLCVTVDWPNGVAVFERPQ